MASSVAEIRQRFYAVLWYGIVALGVLFLSFLLASSYLLIALFVAGVGWLVLLPYHARLGLTLAMSTFTSALIVPFMPGRMYVWEMAALLMLSGIPITLFLRRYGPDFGETLRRNRLMLVGAALYCLVLLQIMVVRGVGFGVLGSSETGGRFYFQQILCAGFPILFAMLPLTIQQFTRLFVIQCLLAVTYVVSDVAFSGVGGKLFWVLRVLELPNDALSFEIQSMKFGLRRFQSAFFFAQALIYLLCVYVPLRALTTYRALWLIPTGIVVFIGGMFGGHRLFFMNTLVPLMVIAFIQRMYTFRNVLMVGLALLPVVVFTYGYATRLPQAAQRSISFLPGIQIDAEAAQDAHNTYQLRKSLVGIGLRMAPDYFWVGKGFGRAVDDYTREYDPTGITSHIMHGKFYNGFVGLLVNTGIFGACAMLLFIAGGTRLAWHLTRRLRRGNSDTRFQRICGLLVGQWALSVVTFFFIHGDAEWAMKTFSLLAAMMLASERLLIQSETAPEEAEPVPVPVPASGLGRLSPVTP